MKSQSFAASIRKGSKELHISSGHNALAKNGAFVKIGKNEITYQIESYTTLEFKKKFKSHSTHLLLKGDYRNKIFPGDSAKLYFNEQEAVHITKILKAPKKNCPEDIFEFEEGHISGNAASVKMTSLSEVYIESAGKYIAPPKNPITAVNAEGDVLKMEVEFDYSVESAVFERDFEIVDFQNGMTYLHLTYPFPTDIKEGDLIMSKKIIVLDREYAGDSVINTGCQTTTEFSPINKIPLMPPNCIAPHTIYNKGIETIDKRLLELEKEITRLKNRN